jgi:hypothetical protein
MLLVTTHNVRLRLQAAEQQVLAWDRAAQALRDLAAQQQAAADSIVQCAEQVGTCQRASDCTTMNVTSRCELAARCPINLHVTLITLCTQETAAAEAAAAEARQHAVELQRRFDERLAGLEKEAAELDARCAEAAAPVAAERETAAAAVSSLDAELDELRYTCSHAVSMCT